MPGSPRRGSGQLVGKRDVGDLCPGCDARPPPRPQDREAWSGENFSRKSWGDAQRGILLPRPQFPRRWWKVGSEGKVRSKRKETAEAGAAPETRRLVLEFSRATSVCQFFPCGTARRVLKSPPPPTCVLMTSLPSAPLHPPRLPAVSRHERSHCPSQTVKKLLEEQRRRQQQPDAGGAPVRPTKPVPLPLSREALSCLGGGLLACWLAGPSGMMRCSPALDILELGSGC